MRRSLACGFMAIIGLTTEVPVMGQSDPNSPRAVTLSFAQDHGGSFPRTISGNETIRVDLSKLPTGAAIFRAVLHPGRVESQAATFRDIAPWVTLEGQEERLPLLPPRYTSFDVTQEVRSALSSGRRTVSFSLRTFPGYQPPFNRLDVTCAGTATREIPAVSGLRAIHREGQTILTWKEPELDAPPDRLTLGEWVGLRQVHVVGSRKIRFRIYRSQAPITSANIGAAEFVDEVEPLSGWDEDFGGISARPDSVVPRYVVRDGADAVPPGTAVYAHNPHSRGKAYYTVKVALDGEEDLCRFGPGEALAVPVEESVGLGVPVLQRIERPEEFNGIRNPSLFYYVRWESPPHSNVPSRAIDYLVAVPRKRPEPSPAGIHLHCWGGSLEGDYGGWYDAGQGAVLISTNEVPYDWWTGYHECRGTWKSWREGVVRDYTQERLVSFLDWAIPKWNLDPARIFAAGSSMGGSGSPSLALRRADRISWCVSWTGVHRPADSPQFSSSYEQVYGLSEWKLLYQDRKTQAFDYFDDSAFVRLDPGRESPLILFGNGKADEATGWKQAYDFWKALQETRRPHVFRWGPGGRGQRELLPGISPGERELGIDVPLGRTLPALTRCTLDDDPGDGDPAAGAPKGQSNLFLYWDSDPAATVDEVGRWSMVLRLNTESPKEECRVDVTPRRCFQFRVRPGTKVKWRNQSADSTELQSGEVSADRWGLVTAPGVQVGRGGNRLTLEIVR